MPKKESTVGDHHERVARIVRYLEEHLEAPFDVDDLARRAAYAKHHFHRVFRGITGETIAAHVRRLRLERAARRLRSAAPSVTVTELALASGYEAPEAFTRAFTALFGVSPSAYKGEPSPRVTALGSGVDAPDVAIRFEPEIAVLALRHVGSYAGVGGTFAAMVAKASAAGIAPSRLFGLCPDDPDVTPEALLRFDACVAPPDAAARAAGLTPRSIPAGTYAVAVHRGSYETLSETYLALIGRWLPGTRYALADEPVVEAYLDDPGVTPAHDCRTEVRVRLVGP
jgi:AraC family transcriptional regulator